MAFFGQPAAESGEGGMVRCCLINGQTQKGFKGDAVVDLAFKFGIGGDLKPFLQKQAFEQHQGRIGLAGFGAFSGMIELVQQQLDRFPFNRVIELFEHRKRTILIGMLLNGKIDKGDVELGFSVSHDASF